MKNVLLVNALLLILFLSATHGGRVHDLRIAEADAATVVDALEEDPAPVAPVPAAAPASPLLPMTGRNGASSAPKTLLNRKQVIVARKKTTR